MSRNASVLILGMLASAAIGQGLAACSTSDGGGATPKDASADQSTADVSIGPAACTGAAPVMKVFDPATATEIDPDWSCYASDDAGTFLALDGGDADLPLDADLLDGDAQVDDASDGSSETDAGVDAEPDASPKASLKVTDFVSHEAIPGAKVDLFFAHSAAGTPDLTATVDANGLYPFEPKNDARLATVRIAAKPDPVPSKSYGPVIWYDTPIPAPPGVDEVSAISQANLALLLAGVLGSQPPQQGLALLVAGARDCRGREAKGAIFTLIDDATGQPVATGKTPGAPRATYFLGGVPNASCEYTSDDQAVWGFINAPVNMPGATHGYTLRMSGRMRATDAAPVTIGEVKVELWPDVASVVRPYRLSR